VDLLSCIYDRELPAARLPAACCLLIARELDKCDIVGRRIR
jgi:hypothetical protein